MSSRAEGEPFQDACTPTPEQMKRRPILRGRLPANPNSRRLRCKHERVRCVHGDEINAVGGKRSCCLDCGRYLDPLPVICSVSGRPH